MNCHYCRDTSFINHRALAAYETKKTLAKAVEDGTVERLIKCGFCSGDGEDE